jgi:hypothetical protein
MAPRQGPLVMAIGAALSAAGLRTSGYEILLRLPHEMLARSLPDDPRKWIEQQLAEQAFELLMEVFMSMALPVTTRTAKNRRTSLMENRGGSKHRSEQGTEF